MGAPCSPRTRAPDLPAPPHSSYTHGYREHVSSERPAWKSDTMGDRGAAGAGRHRELGERRVPHVGAPCTPHTSAPGPLAPPRRGRTHGYVGNVEWETWEGGVEEEHDRGQGCKWGKLTQYTRGEESATRGCPVRTPHKRSQLPGERESGDAEGHRGGQGTCSSCVRSGQQARGDARGSRGAHAGHGPRPPHHPHPLAMYLQCVGIRTPGSRNAGIPRERQRSRRHRRGHAA